MHDVEIEIKISFDEESNTVLLSYDGETVKKSLTPEKQEYYLWGSYLRDDYYD